MVLAVDGIIKNRPVPDSPAISYWPLLLLQLETHPVLQSFQFGPATLELNIFLMTYV